MSAVVESFKNRIRTIEKPKTIFVFCCFVLFFVMIIVNLNSAVEDATIEKVKAAHKEIITDFKENKEKEMKIPMAQDKDVPGMVLINAGDKSSSDITPKDIHNIIVVVLEKGSRSGRINLVGLQKESCVDKTGKGDLVKLKDTFDSDDPEKMYDAIEKCIDYKVDSFIVYNNDTIKKIVDAFYIINANVQLNEAYGINDVPVLNALQKKYGKQYGEEYKEINKAGIQPLNSLQSVSYVNMYSNAWDCTWNDLRHLLMIAEIIKGMKNCNYGDLSLLKSSLFSGDADINKDKLIKITAAIKSYKTWTIDRWPQWSKTIKYKNAQYVMPDNNKSCLKFLHKERHQERGYHPSKTAIKYCGDAEKFYDYVVAYNKEQAEKKRRAEAAKKREAERKAAEKSKEDRDKTSSDTDKKDKTSDTGKSKSSSKKQSSSGSSGKKKTSSSGGNKKDRSGGSSSKPKPKPKPSSDSDDDPGEVVQPDDPGSTPDPQPEDSSHDSDNSDN